MITSAVNMLNPYDEGLGQQKTASDLGIPGQRLL